jgi:hypothetical protein
MKPPSALPSGIASSHGDNVYPPGGDPYEFIELQNLGGTTLDLGGINFSGIDFRFPDLTTLAPGGRFLIASAVDPAAFATRYPDAHVDGHFNRALANGGEKLTLRDREGRTITSVEYNDTNGWPLEADGRGPSLELLDPKGAPSDPASWRASADLGGSPGEAPLSVVPAIVQLNEMMTRNVNAVPNGGANPAWIELHNTGATPAEMGGWRLSNDDNPSKFVFSSAAIIRLAVTLSFGVIRTSRRRGSHGFHDQSNREPLPLQCLNPASRCRYLGPAVVGSVGGQSRGGLATDVSNAGFRE